jgi:hypothetical protein
MARKAHPPADVESNEQRAPLPDVRIETRRISTLRNAPYNPRRISDSALRGLQSSVERFGLVQPIIVNERTGYIVGGHQRVKALKATGATDALVVLVDLPDTEERALNLALNSPAISGEFTEGLGALLDEVQAADADLFEALMLGEIEASAGADDAVVDALPEESNYTRKIETPVYEPTMEAPPPVSKLLDTTRADAMAARINAADLPADVRAFLLRAAERHVVFSFQNIAEFYAHASAEVQDLFEESALVIIDYDRAVAEGFVKLTEKLAALSEGGGDA